jgi:hypothetical protein
VRRTEDETDATSVGAVCDLRWMGGLTKIVLQGVVPARETPYGDGVIDVRGVTKRYGEKVAVDDLTFSVSPGIVAFWFAYIVTRPIGASFADWLSKPPSITGLGLGDGTVSGLALIVFIALVAYVAITKCDIQSEPHVAHLPPQANPGLVLDAEFE